MKKIFILLIVIIIVCFSCQSTAKANKFRRSGEKIRIAIMDFAPKGEMDQKRASAFSEIVRSQIIESQYFEVVERNQLETLLKEAEIQQNLADLNDAQQIIDIGNTLSVKQLLIGSAGKLYNRLFITLRLVNAESGKNIFSHTLFTDEENYPDEIKNIVSDIGDMALFYSFDVTINDIDESISSRNYKKAWTLLNRYLEEHNLNEEISKKRDLISLKLSEFYYKEAKSALRDSFFREARNSINKAIAIDNRDEFIKFRDKIKRDEEHEAEQIKMQRLREKKKLEAFGNDYRSPKQKRRDYFKELSPGGIFIATSSGLSYTDKFQVDKLFSWWGFDVLGILTVKSANQKYTDRGVFTYSTPYAGINGRYQKNDDGSFQFVLNPYVSPYLTFGIKLGNIMINPGLDAGLIFRFSDIFPNKAIAGFTFGGTGIVQIKILKTKGVFVGFKFDYELFPGDNFSYSDFESRFLAGFSF